MEEKFGIWQVIEEARDEFLNRKMMSARWGLDLVLFLLGKNAECSVILIVVSDLLKRKDSRRCNKMTRYSLKKGLTCWLETWGR